MIKVMFVCHGNICRSPMAEFLFKDMVLKCGLQDEFYICSKATSSEEIGNGVHYETKKILNSLGIDCSCKKAIRMSKSDYKEYDYIIVMDRYNYNNVIKIVGNDIYNKIYFLLSFVGVSMDIKDPWYTGNFKETYDDINLGLKAFLKYLIGKYHLNANV